MKRTFEINEKQYIAKIKKECGWYVAIVGDVATQGRTLEEVIDNIKEAMDGYESGTVIVPVKYGDEPLAPTVIKAILKQAGVTEEEFRKELI